MSEVTINGTRLNWTAEHYAGFWGKVERGEWEPQTYREIDRHVGADTIVLDFGANIGAITLYAARRAARAICFEPDPLSRAKLTANIAVNPDIAAKITVVPKAAYSGAGEVQLGSQASGGDSMSSTILPDPKTAWLVETITPREINAMLPPDPASVFVKMDIEGGEYDLIPAARPLWERRNLTLLVQTHQHLLARWMDRDTIRLKTARMFAALRDYALHRVHPDETRRHFGLSLLHRLGRAAPLKGRDWLFTRR